MTWNKLMHWCNSHCYSFIINFHILYIKCTIKIMINESDGVFVENGGKMDIKTCGSRSKGDKRTNVSTMHLATRILTRLRPGVVRL